MEELIKRLREPCQYENCILCQQAADAIEALTAEVSRLQLYANNISSLPDCNSCLKKNACEFRPRPGEYCRINCPAWLGVTNTKAEDDEHTMEEFMCGQEGNPNDGSM